VADKSLLVQAVLTHLLREDAHFEPVNVYADGEPFLRSADLCNMPVAITGWVISPGDGKYLLDQLRARPDVPDIYLLTLEQLVLGPADCIAIEDSRNGLRSAHGAGIPTVLAPSTYTDDQNFDEATWIVDDLRKVGLMELIENVHKARTRATARRTA
jgi:hypothetical protein